MSSVRILASEKRALSNLAPIQYTIPDGNVGKVRVIADVGVHLSTDGPADFDALLLSEFEAINVHLDKGVTLSLLPGEGETVGRVWLTHIDIIGG